MKELARSLLLGIWSRPGADKGRPIPFVASRPGGLAPIQALVIATEPRSEHASLQGATKGVVFLATPFRGTAFQDIAKAAVLFLGVSARLAGETATCGVINGLMAIMWQMTVTRSSISGSVLGLDQT